MSLRGGKGERGANSNIHRIDGSVETLDQQLIRRRFRNWQVVYDLGSRTD
jgi:hypothetical protein